MRRLTFRRISSTASGINRRNSDGFSPLHIAVVHGLTSEVQRLVSAGADVQGKTAQSLAPGQTPLFLAVENGRRDIVPILLAAGAQPLGSSSNCWHPSPLFLAAHKADGQLVELMMRNIRAKRERLAATKSARGGGQRKLASRLKAEVQRFFTLFSRQWPHTEVAMLDTLDEEALIRLRDQQTTEEEELLQRRLTCVEKTLVELFRAGAPTNMIVQGVSAFDWAVNLNFMELATFLIREGSKADRDSVGYAIVCGTVADVADRFEDSVAEKTLRDFKFFDEDSDLCVPLLGMALFNENPLSMVTNLIERGCQLIVGLSGEQVMSHTAMICAQALMLATRLGKGVDSSCDYLDPLLNTLVKQGCRLKGLEHIVRQLFEYRAMLHHATAGLLTATMLSDLETRFEKCFVALFEAGAEPAVDCLSISVEKENVMVIACKAALPNLVACLARRGAARSIRQRSSSARFRPSLPSKEVDVISVVLQRTPVWFKANMGQYEVLCRLRQVLASLLANGALFRPYHKVNVSCLWRHPWICGSPQYVFLTELHVALLSDPYQLVMLLKAGADLHDKKFMTCFHPLVLAQRHMCATKSVDILLSLLLCGFNPSLVSNAEDSIDFIARCSSSLHKYAYTYAVLLVAAGMSQILLLMNLSRRMRQRYCGGVSRVGKLKASCASVIRRCLCKPLPVVLKELPIPSQLKQYILCGVLVDTAPLPKKVISQCYNIWKEISKGMPVEEAPESQVL